MKNDNFSALSRRRFMALTAGMFTGLVYSGVSLAGAPFRWGLGGTPVEQVHMTIIGRV